MTRRKTPNPSQAALFEESQSPLSVLVKENPRVAFSRVLMPYFLGLKAEKYSDITDRMVRAVRFTNFLPYLLPAERPGKGNFVVQGIALNEGEYQRLARWPGAIQRNTRNNTLRARSLDPNADRKHQKADRSVIHDFEKRVPAMQRAVQGIQNEQTVLGGLSREARSPGYAHQDALTMRSWADQARYGIFQNILGVVGREKEWTPGQADLASRSLDVALYFDTKNRFGAFTDALGVSTTYAEEREKLFTNRIEQASRIAGNLALQENFETSV